MHESILGTAERIRRLEVQGARNVAIAAIKAVEEAARESKAKRKENLLHELSEAKEVLLLSNSWSVLKGRRKRLLRSAPKES